MSRLFENLIKVTALGAVLYGAYKLGEKNAISSIEKGEPISEGDGKFDNEITEIHNLIQELKSKVGKTQRDKNNIELLEIKMKQLLKNNK